MISEAETSNAIRYDKDKKTSRNLQIKASDANQESSGPAETGKSFHLLMQNAGDRSAALPGPAAITSNSSPLRYQKPPATASENRVEKVDGEFCFPPSQSTRARDALAAQALQPPQSKFSRNASGHPGSAGAGVPSALPLFPASLHNPDATASIVHRRRDARAPDSKSPPAPAGNDDARSFGAGGLGAELGTVYVRRPGSGTGQPQRSPLNRSIWGSGLGAIHDSAASEARDSMPTLLRSRHAVPRNLSANPPAAGVQVPMLRSNRGTPSESPTTRTVRLP